MQSIISIKGLSKSYGHQSVLDNIGFEVGPGQIIAYLGPNGAGKSTTLKILLGIIADFTGTVQVFGQDVRTAPVEFRKRIGYVPEVPDLFDVISGEEYLLFLARIYGLPEATARKRMTAMAEILMLESALGGRISGYSKGMRQKLMIMASLLHDPELLFWDEPLSGLDANMALIIKELMTGLARSGKTIFYSSHVMEVVERISDRILILNKGQVVADGTFEELKQQRQERNLEELFNSLTGNSMQAEKARALLDAMKLQAQS